MDAEVEYADVFKPTNLYYIGKSVSVGNRFGEKFSQLFYIYFSVYIDFFLGIYPVVSENQDTSIFLLKNGGV